jgi:hypothetical protein
LVSYPIIFNNLQEGGYLNNRRFTAEELRAIDTYDTPEKVQEFLSWIPYNFEEKGATNRCFREALKHRTAHCLEGAIMAAAILSQHGYPPLILCIEASDIDHNMFVYWSNSKVGSVAKSRQTELHGRPPTYENYRDLVMSYYPDYFNWYTQDKKDITIRGWAVVDLRTFSQDWITGENIDFIEEFLYAIPYKRIFPEEKDEFYYCQKDGKVLPI